MTPTASIPYRMARIVLWTLVLGTKFAKIVPQSTSSPVATPAPAPIAGGLRPQPQVTNMVEALRDAGQFGAAAGLLDGLQMKSLTPMTTWLLPNDNAFSGTNYPKNVTRFIDYHVLRELLPFSRLLTLSPGTRMPTFLGTESCVVTNNHQFNFSINNALVVVPDLYTDSTVAVHGINSIMDDATVNGLPLPPSPLTSPIPSEAPLSSETTPSPLSKSPLPAHAPGYNITFPDINAAAYIFFGTNGICTIFAVVSALIMRALL